MSTPYPPCHRCNRPLRPSRAPAADHPGTVRNQTGGYCATCHPLAVLDGTITIARRGQAECGTARGRNAHRWRKEPICEPCRQAWNKAQAEVDRAKRRAEQAPTPVLPDDMPALQPVGSHDLAWQDDALCAQTDPELFFPLKGGTPRPAKTICARCPVKADCLHAAMTEEQGTTWDRYGIRGGYTANERRKLAYPALNNKTAA